MLKIEPPDYRFCPMCGTKLESRNEEGKARKFCSQCHWVYYPRVGIASAALIVIDKKVLLVQRNREPYKGKWMFPAGFLEFGEHPIDTVKREVTEETGLSVAEVKLIDVLQEDDDPRSPGDLVFFYKVKIHDGQVKNDPEENQDIQWFSIDDLPEIAWESHREIAKKL